MKNKKKIATLLASLCLVFVMAASLAGCGGGKEFASVQEYLDAQKDQIDEAMEEMEGSGMSVEIRADGDTLVYHYVYDEEVPIDDSTVGIFEEKLELCKTQFDAVLEEMEKLIDVKEPAIQLIYENPDGTVVYTNTLTK